MAVKLRLARFGKKHAPFFRIVAIDSRKMRNGLYLENLGTYNPTTDEYIQFHIERIDAWLAQGAIPSDAVKKLYKRFKQKGSKVVNEQLKQQERLAVTPTATEPLSAPKATPEAVQPNSVE